MDRLAALAQSIDHWDGPISLAVYVRTRTELNVLFSFVSYMQRCTSKFTQQVSIHLALPFNLQLSHIFHTNGSNQNTSWLRRVPSWALEFPCGQPMELVALLAVEWLTPDVSIYPQNHLRNIARKVKAI